MSTTPRTIVTVQTRDGTPAHHYEFKGYLTITDAGARARALALANPRLDHPTRGHLIACIDIHDFDVTHVNPTTTEE
jgi:hypothetical protein